MSGHVYSHFESCKNIFYSQVTQLVFEFSHVKQLSLHYSQLVPDLKYLSSVLQSVSIIHYECFKYFLSVLYLHEVQWVSKGPLQASQTVLHERQIFKSVFVNERIGQFS